MNLSDVEKIKERLSIEEVVSSYIQIEKAGKNFKARCPFHNEKTPSFIISPDRNSYYCFGCGAKGDIFNFVQEFEGIDFSGALKILADKAGVILSNNNNAEKSKYDLLREIMEEATKFYEDKISVKNNVIDYLKKRNLSDETIRKWRIGFAEDGWQNLLNHLIAKKYSKKDILEAGLIKENSGKYYDRFRKRIIFPIFDSGGRVVAFSGRIFEGKENDAKYLNSPETPLFDKSKILYGFDKAKSVIRKSNFSIIVEGQMDLLLSHQCRYSNTVASSGTALTEEHLKIVSRVSNNVVLAYDSDGAGFRASEKAWLIALNMGLDVKIAPIPKEKDPADIITNNQEEWKKIIKNSRHIIEILLEKLLNENHDQRKIGKLVSIKIIPYLASMSSEIDRAYFIKMMSEKLEVDENAIKNEIERYASNNPESENRQFGKNLEQFFGNKNSDINLKTESELFEILFWQGDQKTPVIKIDEFEKKLKTIIGQDYDEVKSILTKEKESLIFKAEEKYYALEPKQETVDVEKIKKNSAELLRKLKLKYLSLKRKEYQKKLVECEKKLDEKEATNCMIKINELSKQINNLK